MILECFLESLVAFFSSKSLVSKKGDVSTIRGKNKEPVKDEKAYAKKGGALILFFGFATLVMTFLLFVDLYVALAQIVICTIIFGVLWKKMNDKYGA